MIKIIFITIIIISQLLLCSCQIDKTGEDKTNLKAEYDLRFDAYPYNITLYKDPKFKNVQYILNYTCRFYNDTDNKKMAECSTHTTLEESKKIWGSDIKSCVHYFDFFNKTALDECGYQSESLYDVIYRPYKVQFLNLPPTRGGKVKITGYFMRVGNMDIKKMWLNFDPFNGWLYRQLDVEGEYDDPNYDPNNLTVNYVRGYGTQKLCFDRLYHRCFKVSYQSPTIKSTFYNHTTQQITIIGTNFYNESKVINVTLAGVNATKNDIVSTDFEEIVINYPSNQTQLLNIQLYIDTLSTFSNVVIEPVPLSSQCNVTKYNDGIVEIIGTHLASPIDNSNISVIINNNKCLVLYNNNSTIQCKLSKEGADNNQHEIKLCINGICNSNKLLFEYGKPIINEMKQSGNTFTLYGQNHGSFNNKSTLLSLKYNNQSEKLIISPQSITINETSSSFEIPFFCGNATVQLIVNGISSNEFIISPEPLTLVKQLPSTDAKDSLNVLLSYYDCKYYTDSNAPKIKSSQLQGKRINGTYYSFNVGQGSGHKFDYIQFADKELQLEYSYAKPVVSNHSMNITLNNENILTINGLNFGTNSSLCVITYNGIKENCQVDSHYQIKFKVLKLEISANVIVTIDGIKSDNYTLELVNCDVVNDIKYPTTYGCLTSPPAVLYICKGLTSFKSKSNDQLLHATYNDQEIKINIKDDNVTIPIPVGTNSSLLKLYLNGLFSESYQVNRQESLVYHSNINYNEKDNHIKLNIQGINFGEPYLIQLPTLFNSSIDSNNCSLLYHGTEDNKNCTADIIICQISLSNNFNKTILIQDQNNNNNNNNNTITVPYSLIIGSNIIKSNINNIEHSKIQDNKNHDTKLGLAIALPIGLVALIGASVFIAYKYHKQKIDNSKKKNIEIGSTTGDEQIK